MEAESTAQRCAQCGADLSATSASALCPRCLLAVGLDDASGADPLLALPAPAGVRSPASGSFGAFGDYELLEEIARGGMGVVYKARQKSLNRLVAIKMLLAGPFASPEFLARFRAEAETAASLRHANIVSILEVGLHEGLPYFSMDYVAGPNLAQLVQDGPLEAKRAAECVQTLAQTVQYAHSLGVLHRDLKPSNVLVDMFDQPRITDFGLAKHLTDSEASKLDPQLTVTGQMLGSPGFMAPEQAAGDPRNIGAGSDIYSLGAILYWLLTCRPPHLGATLAETVRAVQEDEPVRPRGLNRAIPLDVETICLKCLQKAPAGRYANAQELADDLARFQSDEPIRARRVTTVERAWRWCRRKPVVAGLLVALLLAFSLGLAGVLWQWRRAVTSELSARQHQYVFGMTVAQQRWEEGNVEGARELLEAHVPKQGQADLRGFEWRYLWNLCGQDDSHYILRNFREPINDLVCSPDGKVLAVAVGHTLTLMDVSSHKELAKLEDPDKTNLICRIAWSPRSNDILASIFASGVVKLWNITRHESISMEQHIPGKQAGQKSISFSRDGTKLATAWGTYGASSGIALWNADDRKQIWSANTVNPSPTATFTVDSQAIISGGAENWSAVIWDAANGKELASFPALHTSGIRFIVLSPDGRTLATAAADNRIILWDLDARRPKATLPSPGVDIVAFSPDGHLLVSGGEDGLIRLWDASSGQIPRLLRGHSGSIWALTFISNGEIASGGVDGTVRIWDLKPTREKNLLQRENWSAHCLTFSPDGTRLATASMQRDWIEVWDVRSRRWLTNLIGHNHDTWCAAFSPDGKTLATGSSDSTVRLWDADTFRLADILTNPFPAGPIAFSQDSKVLAVASFTLADPDGRQRLAFWDVPSREKIALLLEAATDAAAVSFSSDNRLVAVGYLDGSVCVWDYLTGRKRLPKFKAATGRVHSLAFSADGILLASGGSGGSLCVYSVPKGRKLGELPAHLDNIWAVAFAPDGKTLASAGNDGTIKLWNLATLQLALTLRQEIGPVYCLAFTKDSSLLASGGSDGDVRLWPAASWEEIRLDRSVNPGESLKGKEIP